ncbi:hypothetical protein [Rufibacter latericius]|uniref:Uncharacterized protein n=1 Tax=Rufibacter latericius TaxID=2487040 RepID=A0A3M9MAT6_9BACT|nr:hypothetical protein [Rufibacter latericius]RNI22682.1 hypothetical protein EFB08_21550 [Rufibacter latericius]
MSFLKQLLTPFVEFDDDKKNVPPKQNAPAPSQGAPTNPGPAPAPSFQTPTVPAPDENVQHPLINGPSTPVTVLDQVPTYSASGTLTSPLPEHEQYFERLIDEANARNPMFQGTDYKEFVDSKVDIDDIQDEAIKYRTAFNVLKSTGLTKEKLLSTGQEYLNLIGRDLNAFQSAHSQQYQKEVRQKELLIQKKAEELQTLTQRLNTLKAEINQITQDINVTKDKLNTTKNSFLLAGENKQREIQTELQKIAQFF